MEINVHPDYVVIEGITIPRPVRIPRSLWIEFWERAAKVKW